MTASDRDLVTADLQRLPGLTTRNWAVEGTQFGLAATGGISVLLGTLVGLNEGIASGLVCAAAVSAPAALLGAVYGPRWRRWLLRDSGRVPVGRWLRRLAHDGGAAAGLSAAASLTILALVSGTPGSLAGAVLGVSFGAAVAALAGAVVVGGLGLPLLLGVGRDDRPRGPLALAFVAGPPALFGAFVVTTLLAVFVDYLLR
jgi:hypothetical protein